MKFDHLRPYLRLAAACLFCSSLSLAITIDREAFTVTNYDLQVQVDPAQQRLAVRGKLTLRNESSAPQKIAVLQISSSLNWRAIKVAGDGAQFITQPYASDIDHTGSLSEAVVTLPAAVSPRQTIELEIAYEGVIPRDATRLTRIGTPEDPANTSDWDQIGENFIGVRGAGHVTWYPIATEVANLSEDESLFETLGRWKTREADSSMHVKINIEAYGDQSVAMDLVADDSTCGYSHEATGGVKLTSADCNYQPLGLIAPSFVAANYQMFHSPSVDVFYLPGHDVAASSFADAADKAEPLISDWFGKLRVRARTADLPNADAAPFESGALLMVPLGSIDPKLAGLSAAHQLTHASFSSWRPWINEGLAHFAQALYLEQTKGRQVALDYMGLHRTAFSKVEPAAGTPRSEDEQDRSLINTMNDELYRSKAMFVWWMLRDMVGDAAMKKTIAAYRPEQDKEPSYMQRLIQAQTQRDLEWFFDDWVYRERGLPDFKIESAFVRKTMTEAYIVTVTVENSGNAGAEVPIIVKFAGGEQKQKLEVRAKMKATMRIEVTGAPSEIVVNDGSVPEAQVKNNVFRIPAEHK